MTRFPALTPHGHLVLVPASDARGLPEDLQRRVEQTFQRGAGHGLLDLGLREVGTALPPAYAFWRDFAARYVTTLCMSDAAPDSESSAHAVEFPSRDEIDSLVAAAPPMAGGEYLSTAVLKSLW